MKLIHSRLIALGLTLGIAGVVGAYTPPTTGAFGVNTDAPINTSALDQDKSGGLSVTVFQARGNALFNQETYIGGAVTGGTIQSDGSNTVTVGNSTYGVSTSVNGSISTLQSVQSNSLVSGGGKKPVCANADGTFFLCSTSAPAAPASNTTTSPTNATLNFYIDGSQQTGGYMAVQSSNDGTVYVLEMFPGTDTGLSMDSVVQTGSYAIVDSNIRCTTTNKPLLLPGRAVDFFLNDGDFYTITLSC